MTDESPDEKVQLKEADFAKLEKLVAKIQAELAPAAEVKHNVRLPGRNSGTNRQIDVLVTQKIGQYPFNIVIDCKDYKSPVDVKGVEEFWGLVDDVGAQKGVLVCPAGFSAAAKQRAQKLQIDLYSPIDTDPHKWQTRVTMPAICDFRSASMAFGIGMSAPLPFLLQPSFAHDLVVETPEGEKLGTSIDVAIARWNNGDWDFEAGDHENVPIFEQQVVHVDNGYGIMVPVDLTVHLKVSRQLYFGQYPIARMSGFHDALQDTIITNAFSVGLVDANDVEKSWRKLDSVSEAPVPPVFTMTGLVGWVRE